MFRSMRIGKADLFMSYDDIRRGIVISDVAALKRFLKVLFTK